jgi:acetyltransferase-like isoleucine patch superfamily enzyme
MRHYVIQRWRYRQTSVAFGARIQGKSILGPGASISAHTRISDSTVGARCGIGSDSRIRNSAIGDDSKISANCRVTESSIGRHAMLGNSVAMHRAEFGDFSYCSGTSTVCFTKIGKFCSVAYGLLSGIGEHPTNLMTTSRIFYSNVSHTQSMFTHQVEFAESSPVTIGNDVWLGSRVFIRNGVKIGDGAIIGAGSVVVRDVEPYSVCVGVPARHLRFRFAPAVIQDLLALRWWDWDIEKLKAAAPFLSQPDPENFLKWAARPG